jgi:hypothetical protein
MSFILYNYELHSKGKNQILKKKKKTMQKLWCRVCLEVAFYDQTGYRGFCLSVIFKGRM